MSHNSTYITLDESQDLLTKKDISPKGKSSFMVSVFSLITCMLGSGKVFLN